ncbi:MAG: Hsp70 family protein, partial [bacterium JZ-2024 1]
NGLVKVTARDRATKAEKSIVVKTTTKRLSREEVRKAQVEMGAFTGGLLVQKAKSAAIYEAESVMYQAEAFLRDRRQYLPETVVRQLESLISTLRSAVEKDNEEVARTTATKLQLALSDAELALK